MSKTYFPLDEIIKAPDFEYPGRFEDHPDADSDIRPRLGYVTIEKISAIARAVRESTHSLS